MSDDAGPEHAAWVKSALERFEGPLTTYVRHLVGDAERARDLVQEAFLRLCRQDRAAIEATLAPWLYTVCRNLAMDERRKGRHMPRTNMEALEERPTGAGSAEDAVEGRDLAARALVEVARLPEGLQEVLRLKFAHGLSYAQIAQVTGLSPSHVGVKIHQGMTALRKRMGVLAPVATPVPTPLSAAVLEGGVS